MTKRFLKARRWLWYGTGLCSIGLGGFSAWIVARQEYLLFPYYYDTSQRPESERAEPVPAGILSALIEHNGEKIETWALLPQSPPRGVAYIFRANMGTLLDHLSLLELAADYGLVGVIFNYPGMGLSSGSPTEASIFTAASAVRKHYDAKYLPPGGKTWIMGYSIGTGPAGILASKIAPDLLILFAPYTSLKDVIASRWYFGPFASFSRVNFPLVEPISRLGRTDLIVATGGLDHTIVPSMSKKVFDAYRGSGRRFAVESPAGTHDHLVGANRPALDEVIRSLGY